jgi:hypothetical protein
MDRVLSALEGQEGVIAAKPDESPKTVSVRYRPSAVTLEDLVACIDLCDFRLQWRHRLREWNARFRLKSVERTAQVVTDEHWIK